MPQKPETPKTPKKHTIAMLAAFDRLKEALRDKRLDAARKFVKTCNGGPKLWGAEKAYPFRPQNARKSPQISRKNRKSEKVVVLNGQGILWCLLARWPVLRGVFALYGQCATGNDANRLCFCPNCAKPQFGNRRGLLKHPEICWSLKVQASRLLVSYWGIASLS